MKFLEAHCKLVNEAQRAFSKKLLFRYNTSAQLTKCWLVYKRQQFSSKRTLCKLLRRILLTNSGVRVGSRQLTIQTIPGKGSFGVVYKDKDVASSRVYALKDVLCTHASEIVRAIREALTLKEISQKSDRRRRRRPVPSCPRLTHVDFD